MKATLQSTTRVVHLSAGPARVWQGETDEGKPIVAFLASVVTDAEDDGHSEGKDFVMPTPLAARAADVTARSEEIPAITIAMLASSLAEECQGRAMSRRSQAALGAVRSAFEVMGLVDQGEDLREVLVRLLLRGEAICASGGVGS